MSERGWATRAIASRRLLPIVLIVAAFFAFGAWALASPPGGGADEDFHLTSVWCAVDGRGELCEPGTSATTREIGSALAEVKECFAFHPETSAACQDLSDSEPDTLTRRGNFAGGYPPVYYAVMNVFASPDIAVSAVIMRVVSVLILLGMLSAMWLLLPIARRGTLLLTWLAVSVPMGVSLVASNNPSGWAMIGAGTLWLAVLGYLEAETPRRRWGLFAVAAVATVLAAGSRGDAALYAVISIGIGAVLAFRRDRATLLRLVPLLAPVFVAVLCFATAGQVQSGADGFHGWQSDGTEAGLTPKDPVDPVAQLFPNLLNLPVLWTGAITGSWGLGWQDVALPSLVQFFVLISFVGLLFVGLLRTGWRKALMLVGVTLVLVVVPLYVLFKSEAPVGEAVQPRYLVPLVVLLVGVALTNERADRAIRLSTAQAVVLGVALTIAYGLSLHTMIRRFTTGLDLGGLNLDAHAEWWWDVGPSPMVGFTLGTLAFAVAAVVALLLVRREAERALLAGASRGDVAG